LRTHGEILRGWKVPLELGEGPEEEYGPVEEDQSCNGMEIGFGRREQKKKEQR